MVNIIWYIWRRRNSQTLWPEHLLMKSRDNYTNGSRLRNMYRNVPLELIIVKTHPLALQQYHRQVSGTIDCAEVLHCSEGNSVKRTKIKTSLTLLLWQGLPLLMIWSCDMIWWWQPTGLDFCLLDYICQWSLAVLSLLANLLIIKIYLETKPSR